MSYRLGVRWGPRPETARACASRFAQMLATLAATHPDLADWRRKADTKAAAYKPFCTIPPRLDELEAIFYQARRFTSASHELDPELGFATAAWNGRDEPRSLSLSLNVGEYPPGRLYPNVVELTGLRETNAQLVNAVVLRRILLAMAESWQADWGVVETWAYKGLTEDANQKPLVPYGGWLTYLSRKFAENVTLPPDVHADRLSDGGLFMSVSDEPFDIANPIHVAKLDAVQKALAPVQRSTSEAFRAAYPS